jgi:uncharacterized membrane protein
MLSNGLIFWRCWLPAAYWGIGSFAGTIAGAAGGPAQRVLAERHAGGEIDDEEYRRRLDVLRGR